MSDLHPEHPFDIQTVRQIKVKSYTRIFQTIQKALGLESHDIHELTVLVRSDKIKKQGENK
jgi:hypothetical protein